MFLPECRKHLVVFGIPDPKHTFLPSCVKSQFAGTRTGTNVLSGVNDTKCLDAFMNWYCLREERRYVVSTPLLGPMTCLQAILEIPDQDYRISATTYQPTIIGGKCKPPRDRDMTLKHNKWFGVGGSRGRASEVEDTKASIYGGRGEEKTLSGWTAIVSG